jgi:hypothetical protein
VIGAVHAGIGAAIGAILRKKSSAFLAGIASHLVADAIPHTDFPVKVEVPLMAGTLACIAAWCGADSPEFWGALGGIAPDAEHGLLVAGIITPDQEKFPTHVRNGKYHGHSSGERLSQLIIGLAALATIAFCSCRD